MKPWFQFSPLPPLTPGEGNEINTLPIVKRALLLRVNKEHSEWAPHGPHERIILKTAVKTPNSRSC